MYINERVIRVIRDSVNRVTKYLYTQEYADGFDYDYGDVPNQAAFIAYLERLRW